MTGKFSRGLLDVLVGVFCLFCHLSIRERWTVLGACTRVLLLLLLLHRVLLILLPISSAPLSVATPCIATNKNDNFDVSSDGCSSTYKHLHSAVRICARVVVYSSLHCSSPDVSYRSSPGCNGSALNDIDLLSTRYRFCRSVWINLAYTWYLVTLLRPRCSDMATSKPRALRLNVSFRAQID